VFLEIKQRIGIWPIENSCAENVGDERNHLGESLEEAEPEDYDDGIRDEEPPEEYWSGEEYVEKRIISERFLRNLHIAH
jgi:hypothetical protein